MSGNSEEKNFRKKSLIGHLFITETMTNDSTDSSTRRNSPKGLQTTRKEFTMSKIKENESAANKKAAKAETGNAKGQTKALKAAKKEKKGETIGAMAVRLLQAGTSAKETLEQVLKANPGAKTTMACIYWYANHNGIKLQKPAAQKKAAA
jgi:hypothetical protein